MCITTAGKILSIKGNKAVVELNGAKREVRIDLVKVKEGDYVYCASGIAVEKAEV
jgi:hydrogenase assembly chaperone HypC/HupF